MATQKEVLLDPVFNNNPIAAGAGYLFGSCGNGQLVDDVSHVYGCGFRDNDV